MIIQSFGLEIRKLGSLGDLYREVDMVLSKPIDVCSLTVAHTLQKMLKSNGHCDVSAIRELAKICNIIIPAERMSLYHAVHCMDWSEMVPEYSKTIMCMILDDFRPVLNPEVK